MSGPPRKPAAIKIAEGNPGKHSLKNVPQFDGVPKAPRWFSKGARKLWRRLVPQLAAKGLMADVFGPQMEGLCAAYSRAVDAERIIAKEGMTFTTDKGYVGQHPAIGIAATAWAQVEKFAARFGLTPADVGKVAQPHGRDKSLRELLEAESPSKNAECSTREKPILQ